MCFQKGNEFNDLTVKELKESLKYIRGKEVRLLGGEPTLHKDLCDMIKVIHDSGNHAYFATNGIALSKNEKLIKELFELQENGRLTVNVSMNGGLCKDTTIKLHGNDELDMKLQALSNMRGFKKLSVSAVLCRGVNEFVLHDLPHIRDMFNLSNITFRSELNAPNYYKTNEFLFLALKEGVITRKDLSKIILAGFTDKQCKGQNCCVKLIKEGYTIHWYEFCTTCWRIRKYDPETQNIKFYSEG